MESAATVFDQNMNKARELCPVEREGDPEVWLNEIIACALEMVEHSRRIKAGFYDRAQLQQGAVV